LSFFNLAFGSYGADLISSGVESGLATAQNTQDQANQVLLQIVAIDNEREAWIQSQLKADKDAGLTDNQISDKYQLPRIGETDAIASARMSARTAAPALTLVQTPTPAPILKIQTTTNLVQSVAGFGAYGDIIIPNRTALMSWVYGHLDYLWKQNNRDLVQQKADLEKQLLLIESHVNLQEQSAVSDFYQNANHAKSQLYIKIKTVYASKISDSDQQTVQDLFYYKQNDDINLVDVDKAIKILNPFLTPEEKATFATYVIGIFTGGTGIGHYPAYDGQKIDTSRTDTPMFQSRILERFGKYLSPAGQDAANNYFYDSKQLEILNARIDFSAKSGENSLAAIQPQIDKLYKDGQENYKIMMDEFTKATLNVLAPLQTSSLTGGLMASLSTDSVTGAVGVVSDPEYARLQNLSNMMVNSPDAFNQMNISADDLQKVADLQSGKIVSVSQSSTGLSGFLLPLLVIGGIYLWLRGKK
jgi:hypothetical protein